MLPQFNNQNPPVTPNNGNPNTIYNSKKGRMPEFREFEVLPDDRLGPAFGSEFSVDNYPATKPAMGARSAGPLVSDEPVFTPAPVHKPMPVVDPAFAPPAVPVPKPVPVGGTPDNSAPVRGPGVGGEYARFASPQPSGATPTTMGQWLPRFALDTSAMGTQFGPGSAMPGLDYWRSRLAQITQQGVSNQPTPATPSPQPVTPPVAAPALPEFSQPALPQGPIAGVPDRSGAATMAPSSQPDFWRTWNAQQAINQTGLSPNTRLPADVSVRSGGLSSLGDLVESARRELAGLVPSSGRDWLRLLADVGIAPGAGDLLMPRFNVPLPGADENNPAGITRGVDGMDAMLQDNLRAYRRDLQAAGMPGAEASDEQLISQARARLQAHYDGQAQMSTADVNRLRALVDMVSAFESGNARSLAMSPARPNIVGGTGGYIAPSAAVMLRDFTTATTRGGSKSPEERTQEFLDMIRRNSGTQQA